MGFSPSEKSKLISRVALLESSVESMAAELEKIQGAVKKMDAMVADLVSKTQDPTEDKPKDKKSSKG